VIIADFICRLYFHHVQTWSQSANQQGHRGNFANLQKKETMNSATTENQSVSSANVAQSGKMTLWNAVKTPIASLQTLLEKGMLPLYFVQMATEQFGSMGMGWGVDIVGESIIDCAQMYDSTGIQMGVEKLQKTQVRLWYEQDGKRSSVVQFGQAMLVELKNGKPSTDVNAVSKAFSNAMVNCLAYLGFAADAQLVTGDMDPLSSGNISIAIPSETAEALLTPAVQAVTANVTTEENVKPDVNSALFVTVASTAQGEAPTATVVTTAQAQDVDEEDRFATTAVASIPTMVDVSRLRRSLTSLAVVYKKPANLARVTKAINDRLAALEKTPVTA
jgi:hypothetical protein